MRAGCECASGCRTIPTHTPTWRSWPDPPAGAEALAAREPLVAGFDRIVGLARALGADVPEDLRLADDPIRAAWEATTMAPIGPLDVVAILAEDDPVGADRPRRSTALGDAAELLELRLG